ncbi:MAG TPA: beta-propeller fold lactonase family protein [Gaiellaceae bacterium]|nr:beta-propeller fold lactonase family protein [Gaiellaceae bacterium]
MRRHSCAAILVTLAGLLAIGLTASLAGAGARDRLTNVHGTVWVANRGAHTIRGFDSSTGDVVSTVAMSGNSQPGDLAFARGKLYVAEEFGTPPAIAIVDPRSGTVLKRIELPPGSRPHHVHASRGGRLVAFGLYGTDTVAVVDTCSDELLGRWDINPDTVAGRAHAAVFSPDGRVLYVASDASNEIVALDPRSGEILWRLNVPGAHELAVTRDGRTAYVSRRTANRLAVIDLTEHAAYTDVLELGLPDTLRLSRGDRQLTVGLRTTPAQLAVVDTKSLTYALVRIGPPLETTTVAGHQWTSRNGRYTFAAYEGGSSPGIAVIDHRDGNAIVGTLPYPGRPHGVDLARDQLR